MSSWRHKLSVFSQRKYYLAPFWRTGLLLPSQQFLGSCTGEQNRMWNTVSSLVVQQMFYMWSSFLTTTNFRNCFSLCNKPIFLNIISFRFYEDQSCKCDFGKPCIVHINIWVQRGRMVNLVGLIFVIGGFLIMCISLICKWFNVVIGLWTNRIICIALVFLKRFVHFKMLTSEKV